MTHQTIDYTNELCPFCGSGRVVRQEDGFEIICFCEECDSHIRTISKVGKPEMLRRRALRWLKNYEKAGGHEVDTQEAYEIISGLL